MAVVLFECAAVLFGTILLGAAGTPQDQPASTSTNTLQAEPFSQPKTLAELLAVKPDQLEQVEVALINLLCAEGLRGSEDLNVQACLDRLKAYAIYVDRETKRNEHHFTEHPEQFSNSLAYYRMGMMGTVLAEDVQIRYDPKLEQQQLTDPIASRTVEGWNGFFADSKEVFLHGLLGNKPSGTCASMPFLYVTIGRRLGYPVTIAATLHHFYVRYEEGEGKHLNIEATENRGFATPSDEEYRHGEVPITEEAITGSGWLQPLSNRAILGMCLLTRSSVLRSMKQYDQEIAALDQASRYLPDTPLMKRVIEKNRQLARNLHSADRWDELWNQLDKMSLPTGGPKSGYFQNRRFQVESSMNQSTNLTEIERDVNGLNDDLRRYMAEIADDPAKMAAAFSQPHKRTLPPQFLALLQQARGGSQTRRVVLAPEQVPSEYYLHGVPPELMNRLRELTTEQDMIVEMNAYYAEELSLRNQAAQDAANRTRPELLQGSPGTKTLNLPIPNQHRNMVEAIQLRRAELDQEPAMQPPLQIDFLPPQPSHLPLTVEPQEPINASANGKGKQ